MWPICLIICQKYSFHFRSVPSGSSSAALGGYQWPTSPILPPISSRTPHLVPETLIPTTNELIMQSPSTSSVMTSTTTAVMANTTTGTTSTNLLNQSNSWISWI